MFSHLCKCEDCPLGAHHRKHGTFEPIEADLSPGAKVLVVGTSPGKFEVEAGVPMVGPLGVDLLSMLEANGRTRDDLSWTASVMCRYPKDDAKGFLGRLRKKNRDRKELGEPPLSTPAACCRPRLDAEVRKHEVVLTLGSPALKAVGVTSPATGTINNDPGLDSVRGAPAYTATGKKLIATRLDWKRDPKWRTVVLEDVERALRYADDELTWEEPEVIYTPAPKQLWNFLFNADGTPRLRAAVYDVETKESGHDPNGNRLFDPMTDPLRCIGIGNHKEVVVIPFLSVDGTTTFYTDADEEAVRETLKVWCTHPDVLKIGHNAGYYDRMVIENHLGVTPAPLLDTHPLAKLAEPEYPKGLGFQGSRFTDAPAWKSEHSATEAETDQELWLYNARDIAVNALIAAPLQKRAKQRKHYQFLKTYERLQDWCVGMHKLGLRVDEEVRARHEARLERVVAEARIDMVNAAGDHNPGSYTQVGKILYDGWGLPILGVTGTGEPSTDDDTIRSLLASGACNEEQKAYLLALRRWRGAEKKLGTYVRKWRPGYGLVDRRGFLYPDYNAAGTVMWRFSSRNPNAQNTPYELRDCFVPPEGMAYVGADYDQLELRGAAGLAEADYYLDAFDKMDIDPHNMSGEMVFGDAYWKAAGAPRDKMHKGTGAFKRRRELITRFVYASLYGAKPPTILNVLTSAEGDDGKLMFLGLTIREVRTMHARWLRAAPEFQRWWQKTRTFWRRHGYVEEPLWGMRRYSPEDDLSELVNAPSQGLGGAIVHLGTARALREFTFEKGEGLCLQVHDSVAFCVAEDAAEELRDVLNEKLTVVVPLGKKKRPVTFTAEADIGHNLKEI